VSGHPTTARLVPAGEAVRRYQRGKQDRNALPIKHALEAAGCLVLDLSGVGGGCPDFLVYRKATGLLRLVEVKNPETTLRRNGQQSGRRSATGERQADFARRFPVWRVLTVADALEAMEIQSARERQSESAQVAPSEVKDIRQYRRCGSGQ
jgi:hypothetical protein